jgi:hypothetical protein
MHEAWKEFSSTAAIYLTIDSSFLRPRKGGNKREKANKTCTSLTARKNWSFWFSRINSVGIFFFRQELNAVQSNKIWTKYRRNDSARSPLVRCAWIIPVECVHIFCSINISSITLYMPAHKSVIYGPRVRERYDFGKLPLFFFDVRCAWSAGNAAGG